MKLNILDKRAGVHYQILYFIRHFNAILRRDLRERFDETNFEKKSSQTACEVRISNIQRMVTTSGEYSDLNWLVNI